VKGYLGLIYVDMTINNCHLVVKLKLFQHRPSNEVIDRLMPKR